jgi:DNA-binding NtrC family response regulator
MKIKEGDISSRFTNWRYFVICPDVHPRKTLIRRVSEDGTSIDYKLFTMLLQILIVEDLFIEANDLRIILERAGHTVTGMPKSVDQALASLKRCKPDIVLLDIFLKGDLTGIHLARNLAAANIPFVYLSANSNASTLESAKSTQPFGFLFKPFREKDVLVALDIAIHRHRHILETTRRQESSLGSLLIGIVNQAATQEHKLLLLARAFKTFIPYDVMFIDTDPDGERQRPYFGCRYDGPENFQPVNMDHLFTRLRLSACDWPLFRDAIPFRRKVAIVAEAEWRSMGNRVTERLQRHFGVRSLLSVPAYARQGKEFSIFFLGAQPDHFNVEHGEVLKSLQGLLASVMENIHVQGYAPLQSAGTPPFGRPAETQQALNSIVGESTVLKQVLQQVQQVAPFESTVLILGETGVGKESVAAAVHEFSPRNGKPFIKVNCAAIPEMLLESELFGHERGAFTSAADRRIGKFEQAHGGTLFLDEIGELPLQAQSKLLRVLQEKEIERIGGNASIKVDVRIIAATNRRLHREVAAGNFRTDLYYRLNVFPVTVPPLRERKQDIPLLAEHFLRRYALASGGIVKTISPEVGQRLINYPWPGNIRELQYVIERCTLLEKGPVITAVDLPEDFPVPFHDPVTPDAVPQEPDMEKDQILDLLIRCNGKVSGKGGAAECLGVNPNTLTSRMKKLGIQWTYTFK